MASSLGIWNSVTSEKKMTLISTGFVIFIILCFLFIIEYKREKKFIVDFDFFLAAMCIELNQNRVFAKIISNS